MKQVLQRCMYIESLEPLLQDAPPNILKYILGQFSKVRDAMVFYLHTILYFIHVPYKLLLELINYNIGITINEIIFLFYRLSHTLLK